MEQLSSESKSKINWKLALELDVIISSACILNFKFNLKFQIEEVQFRKPQLTILNRKRLNSELGTKFLIERARLKSRSAISKITEKRASEPKLNVTNVKSLRSDHGPNVQIEVAGFWSGSSCSVLSISRELVPELELNILNEMELELRAQLKIFS